MAAYQAHDRVVAADSKPAATLALLQDWWAAYQEAERDPTQEVIVLAARRAEVDRLNTACQELLAARGRLGGERLQVEDRQLAVGDRVVCGHNAIGELGVANGSRGTITALDSQARTLTLRLDGADGREVTLPGSYLDGRGRGERNRRVDLAYATTGHRAQGLTRGRALVRLTGTEDVNWLYVQLSRARQDTRLYAVVGPEPHGGGELDLPDREQPDGYLQLAQALSRAGGQTLAIDTPSSPDLQRLTTAELRAERDRLRRQLDQAPRDRSRELARATAHRQHAEEALAAPSSPPFVSRPACFAGCGAATTSRPDAGALAVATQQANRAQTESGSCASTSSAAPAGWKPTSTSARNIGRWCGPWPGSGAPPASPSKRIGPAMSWRRRPRARVDPWPAGLAPGRRRDRGLPARLPDHRPGPGPRPRAPRPGPAGRPAAGPHGHRTRPGQAARHRPQPRRHRPPSAPTSTDLRSGVVGQAPSEPPASSRKMNMRAGTSSGSSTGDVLGPSGAELEGGPVMILGAFDVHRRARSPTTGSTGRPVRPGEGRSRRPPARCCESGWASCQEAMATSRWRAAPAGGLWPRNSRRPG